MKIKVKWELYQLRNLKSGFLLVLVLLTAILSDTGCKHEIPQPMTFNTNGNDGNNNGNGITCDPDSIYFQQQILPFLISNCAKSGCHDAGSAQDDVVLNSYNNVMNTADVSPFDLDDSDIWEVINETDPDKVMPPPGENPLNQDQIDLIADWINQGAKNLVCDDGLAACDTATVSFASDIKPIIQNKCIGCHGSAHSGNAFIDLSDYSGVSSTAATNQLVGAVSHSQGYTPMPMSGPMISNCEIGKIRNWVNDGYLNN